METTSATLRELRGNVRGRFLHRELEAGARVFFAVLITLAPKLLWYLQEESDLPGTIPQVPCSWEGRVCFS